MYTYAASLAFTVIGADAFVSRFLKSKAPSIQGFWSPALFKVREGGGAMSSPSSSSSGNRVSEVEVRIISSLSI
jgi:hypothetical protein